jgi:hypothetical protein
MKGGSSIFISSSSREVVGRAAFAPVLSGDKISYPQYSQHHLSSFREENVLPLTSSNFTMNLGRYQRGVTSTPGNPSVSQRGGRVSLDNVTKRDSKRPSERPWDREYHRRFSIGVTNHSHESPQVSWGGNAWPREGFSSSSPARNVVAVDFGLHGSSPPVRPNSNVRTGAAGQRGQGGRGEGGYYIRLICAGESVEHLVWPSMLISELMVDAGSIFGLDPEGISLVLFSASPLTLRRDSTIRGPPLVAPNSSVMVFSFPPQPMQYGLPYGPHTPPQGLVTHGNFAYTAPNGAAPVGTMLSPAFSSSKLLSTFKLP